MNVKLFILLVSFLTISVTPASGKVVYVYWFAPGGPGSGSSWENPCMTITAGLAASASGDEIWVKSATYREAIEMKEGVALYGGFPTDGSPSFDQRDWKANETIINATGLNTHVVVGADFATLDGFTITGGFVDRGGGVYCYRTSPTLSNCTVTGNRAVGDYPNGRGGGVYCYESSPRISYCRIISNVARNEAGVCCVESSSPVIVSCLIIGNSAENNAGGVGSTDSSPTLANCTLAGNSAGSLDVGGMAAGSGNPVLVNCVLWNNEKEDLYVLDFFSATVTYCCLEGSWAGEGNFGADPLFVSPETGDYRLQNGSPCIDRGLVSAAPDSDVDGNPRPGLDGKVDIGAYESPPEYEPAPRAIRYVRADAAEGGDGSSWETAFRTVQAGLDAAAPLDEVWVAEGTYREGPLLQLATDVGVYGGFQGNETQRDERDWNAHPARIVSVSEGERMLSVQLPLYTVQALLDGLTIEGNVSCEQRYTSVTLTNCTVRGDLSGNGGNIKAYSDTLLRAVNCDIESQAAEGGVYCAWGGYVFLTGCRIRNSAGDGVLIGTSCYARLADCEVVGSASSGVRLWLGSANLSGCTVSNSAEEGIKVEFSAIALTNCAVTNNGGTGLSFDWPGPGEGGMPIPSDYGCEKYSPSITNCLFAGNAGYGLHFVDLSPVLVNCTIADNLLGGFYSSMGHYTPPASGESNWWCENWPRLTNCIIAEATPLTQLWKYFQEEEGDDGYYYYELVGQETPPHGEGLDLTYSCIAGGWPDEGNIDLDPLFADPAGGDYHLLPGSPCIDSASATGPDTDLDGNLRPIDVPGVGYDGPGAYDIGAYEFGSVQPSPTPTPSGTPESPTPTPTLSPTPSETPGGPTRTPTPPGPATPIPGDLNCDGTVNHNDLLLFQEHWHRSDN